MANSKTPFNVFDSVVDEVMACDEQIIHLNTILSVKKTELEASGQLRSLQSHLSTVRVYRDLCMHSLGNFQRMEGYH